LEKKLATFDVYGIGNAIVDLQVEGKEEDLTELGLQKGSMKLVDSEEQLKILQKLQSKTVHHSSGGAAANSMITLAQLGGKGAYGCIVGDDERGEFYLEEMRVLGVEVQNLPISGKPTGTSVVIITPDGERTMNTHLGATADFTTAHLNSELLVNSKWLLIEGYLFSNDSGRDAVFQALKLAKERNIKVLLTLGAAFIPQVFRDLVLEAVAMSDLVICNEEEASALTGFSDREQLFNGCAKLCRNFVVTLSEEGAELIWDGERTRINGFPAQLIDSTGAGDAFCGGFIYGITAGLSPIKSSQLGCLIASKVVSQLGARLKQDAKELLKEIA